MEIEKSYFTLPEILERWSMSEADLVYLAENDQLRLSIRVFNLAVEFGDYEETESAGGKTLDAAIEISYIVNRAFGGQHATDRG